MHAEEFEQIVDEQLDACRQTLVVKAREYATVDRLHNFKVAAELQTTTMQEALAGMMAKHTVSIYDMCTTPHDVFDMAMWDEKITDHINYLLLLRAVVIEGKKPRPKFTQDPLDIQVPSDTVVYN